MNSGWIGDGDISPLTNLTKLSTLWLIGSNVSDISPLSNLTNLTYLQLGNNGLTDISALSNLTNLWFLNISNNNITDYSPLDSLTNLTNLQSDQPTWPGDTGTVSVHESDYFDIGSGSMTWSIAGGQKGYFYTGSGLSIANVNTGNPASCGGAMDWMQTSYQGAFSLEELTDVSAYTYTSSTVGLCALNYSGDGGNDGLLVFKQGDRYGVLQFTNISSNNLTLDWWLGDPGVTDFSTAPVGNYQQPPVIDFSALVSDVTGPEIEYVEASDDSAVSGDEVYMYVGFSDDSAMDRISLGVKNPGGSVQYFNCYEESPQVSVNLL